MLSEKFWDFHRNSFIKKSVEQSKNKKDSKKRYHKISSLRKFIKYEFNTLGLWYQFVIFNPWKAPWNWIAFIKIILLYNLLVISADLTWHWTTYKRDPYVKSYCFFETIAERFKSYKLVLALHCEDNVKYEILSKHLFQIKPQYGSWKNLKVAKNVCKK